MTPPSPGVREVDDESEEQHRLPLPHLQVGLRLQPAHEAPHRREGPGRHRPGQRAAVTAMQPKIKTILLKTELKTLMPTSSDEMVVYLGSNVDDVALDPGEAEKDPETTKNDFQHA